MEHTCEKRYYCMCYPLGLEPHPDCPQHGYPWPPRCGTCGRFMAWPVGLGHADEVPALTEAHTPCR